jgi:hypothetical protein
MIGAAPGSRPAVQEDDRLRAPRAASLPIEAVTVADLQPPGLIRFDRRIEGAALGHRRLRFVSSSVRLSLG